MRAARRPAGARGSAPLAPPGSPGAHCDRSLRKERVVRGGRHRQAGL